VLGRVDFANLFIDLSGQHPVSLADAQLRGLPVIAYGMLINDIVSFVIIAFVVFMVVRAVNRMKREKEEVAMTKGCPYCLSTIPINATRCSGCTSDLKAIEA
jgi:large conductance mechanosensitive channel